MPDFSSKSNTVGETTSQTGYENEKYWFNNLGWYEEELARRRVADPSYLAQEVYLSQFFSSCLQNSKEPIRVLEFGCGFGRHLKYISTLGDIELHGCDLSPKSLELISRWAGKEWAEKHITIVEPRTVLPYPDDYFDVVFTVSVLIHIDPESIQAVTAELARVCKGTILHIENVRSAITYKSYDTHEGCWVHSLEDVYAKSGYLAEVLPSPSKSHGLYMVSVDGKRERFQSFPVNRLQELEENYADIHAKYTASSKQLKRMKGSRAFQIQIALSENTFLTKTAALLFDGLQKIFSPSKPRVENRSEDFDFELIKKCAEPEFKSVLSICHPTWLGVRSAAEGQPSDLLLLRGPDAEELDASVLLAEGYEVFVFNGFWPGYGLLIKSIKSLSDSAKVFCIYHGSFFQLLEDSDAPDTLSSIFSLCKSKYVDRIGFVKSNMSEAFRNLDSRIDCRYVMNENEVSVAPSIKHWGTDVKIAIPVDERIRKNSYTQLIAALQLPDVSEIHIWFKPDYKMMEQLGFDLSKVVVHGPMPKAQVIEIFSKVTAVIYVTISECYPMSLIEAISVGTPCFTGNTNGVLDDFPDLASRLTVNRADDAVSIAEHITTQAENYSELSELCLEASKVISINARESFRNFIA